MDQYHQNDESTKDESVTGSSSTTSMESNGSPSSANSFINQWESSLLHPPHNYRYHENRMNGLQAHFLIELERDQTPNQVDSNLNLSKPP